MPGAISECEAVSRQASAGRSCAAGRGIPIISAGSTAPMGFRTKGGVPITVQVCRLPGPAKHYRFRSAPMARTGLPPSSHISSLHGVPHFLPSRRRLSLSGSRSRVARLRFAGSLSNGLSSPSRTAHASKTHPWLHLRPRLCRKGPAQIERFAPRQQTPHAFRQFARRSDDHLPLALLPSALLLDPGPHLRAWPAFAA
jgi:hypothetical protein